MLLSGEFDSPAVKLQKGVVPLNIDEAKWRIERSAYLSFGPAQYKMVRLRRVWLGARRADLALSRAGILVRVCHARVLV